MFQGESIENWLSSITDKTEWEGGIWKVGGWRDPRLGGWGRAVLQPPPPAAPPPTVPPPPAVPPPPQQRSPL